MKKLCHIIIGFTILTQLTFAQPYSFSNITEKDGLSDNQVIDIFEDSRGFLWFVTFDGINNYNGYEFNQFINDPFDSNSISPGITTAITECCAGNIWMGTTRGLNQYDPQTNTFKYYSTMHGLSFHQITKLYRDDEDLLWVGMGDIIGGSSKGGIAYFDKDKNRFISSVHDSIDINSLSNNYVTAIVDDKNGNIWIGTANGLNKLNKLNKSYSRFYIDKSKSENNRKNFINDIFFDSQNNLWIAADNGLYKFDKTIEAFQKIIFDSDIIKEGDKVLSVYAAPSDQRVIWIGTEKGLFEFNANEGTSNQFTNDPNDPTSLPANIVRKIIEDHSGILWFATGNSGLAKLNRFKPNFKYLETDLLNTIVSENNVYSIFKDSNGNIFAGTEENIIKLDPSTGLKTPLAKRMKIGEFLKNNNVNSILKDNQDRFWIGTSENGLLLIDSDTLKVHYSETSAKDKVQSNRISFIASFDNKNIWVGTRGGGLDQINLDSYAVKSHQIDSTINKKVNVLSYYNDGQGFMWIGTTRGIRKFDLIMEEFVPFKYESDFNNSIGNDMVLNFNQTNSEDSVLWLGTLNRGLCKLNLSNGEFKRFTSQNSNLPNNTINNILSYGNNTLWLTAKNRLVRLDTKSEDMRVYSSDDGLNTMQFHIKSSFKDKDNMMYFGGSGGILYFNPSKVRKNLYPPKLVIDNILINGKSIIRKEKKSFIQHLIDEKEITLNYDENSFTIEFAALHYASPKNNNYEYQLVNYDYKPIKTNEIRKISYNNLNPGNYTFLLKASNADGIMASREIEFAIIISPPFYKTWWAYTFYILLLVGLIQLYRKYETNKELEAARLKESELRAEQAELKAETEAANARVVQIENERKTKELEDARKLQLSMLPENIPSSEDYEIAVYMKTASEVGGDYYDFSTSEDGTLNIGFGDATGHGMQAGVVVSLIKGLFVSDSAENDLSTFMLKSNNTIKKSRLGRMMMAFSLMKLKENKVQFSSAGMPPVLLYSESSNHIDEINLMGMPLGAMMDFPYKEIDFNLSRGDTLLFMSDGLPELTNKDGEQFAYFRVSKLLKEVGYKNINEIIDAVIEAAENWLDGEPLQDDITLLVLKIK